MRKMYALAAWTPVLLGSLALSAAPVVAQSRTVQPVLAFPEQGLDDPAAYQGYQTRFFRDTKGNVVQVYLDARSGRVVNLLPDAVNESVGFTVRDGAGKPIRLEWGSADAIVVKVRRLLLEAARAFEAGAPAPWNSSDIDYRSIRARSVEFDAAKSWREFVHATPGKKAIAETMAR